jgi:hypothetical protein
VSLDPRALWASSELSVDPFYQPSMDVMYHFWVQDEYAESRRWYECERDHNIPIPKNKG